MFPVKSAVLEDKVGYNHILQSVRRLYPSLFETHLLPFLDDNSLRKSSWAPKIRFLDLCVSLDITCEAISLISHVVKWKRSEQYTVLTLDLSNSHNRKFTTMIDSKVISTSDTCINFLKQLFFESLIRPVLLSSRTLGSFTWFPHASMMPKGEGAPSLGPFENFVLKTIHKGQERPMYRDDLSSGFSWIDLKDFKAYISSAHQRISRVSSADAGRDCFNLDERVVITITHNFIKRNRNGACDSKFSIIHRIHGSVSDASEGFLMVEVLGVECGFSGAVRDEFVRTNILAIARSLSFSKEDMTVFVQRQMIDQHEEPSNQDTIMVELIPGESFSVDDPLAYTRLGPDWVPVGLVLIDGDVKELKETVAQLKVSLDTKDVMIFLAELYPEHMALIKKGIETMLKKSQKHEVDLSRVDLIKCFKDVGLTEHDLVDCFSGVIGWVKLSSYTLAYSKHLKDLVIAHPGGGMRLGGVCCRLLREGTSTIEIE